MQFFDNNKVINVCHKKKRDFLAKYVKRNFVKCLLNFVDKKAPNLMQILLFNDVSKLVADIQQNLIKSEWTNYRQKLCKTCW